MKHFVIVAALRFGNETEECVLRIKVSIVSKLQNNRGVLVANILRGYLCNIKSSIVNCLSRPSIR